MNTSTKLLLSVIFSVIFFAVGNTANAQYYSDYSGYSDYSSYDTYYTPSYSSYDSYYSPSYSDYSSYYSPTYYSSYDYVDYAPVSVGVSYGGYYGNSYYLNYGSNFEGYYGNYMNYNCCNYRSSYNPVQVYGSYINQPIQYGSAYGYSGHGGWGMGGHR